MRRSLRVQKHVTCTSSMYTSSLSKGTLTRRFIRSLIGSLETHRRSEDNCASRLLRILLMCMTGDEE